MMKDKLFKFNQVCTQIILIFIFFSTSCSNKGSNSDGGPNANKKQLANITNSQLESLNSNNITLAWSNPTDIDFHKVLILRNTNSISDVPTTGQDYTGIDSIGSSQIVYNDKIEIFQITGDEAHILHYYKLFSTDTNFNYASGVEISAGGADADNDGLIEIYTAEMLDNVRHDLEGTSYKTSGNDADRDSSGCPSDGCNGYELTANIDLIDLLDMNNNNHIDTRKIVIDGKTLTVINTDRNKDTSWAPIGDFENPFNATFEGNHHTIVNLWVNISTEHAGLFEFTKDTEIRNTRIFFGSVFLRSTLSNSSSGGLVGHASGSLTIINSYVTNSDGIFSTYYSGGLVGSLASSTSLTIINSYFSGPGGIISYSSSSTESRSMGNHTSSGGLVGYARESHLKIINSYFYGQDGVYSHSPSSEKASSGGLVGELFSDANANITNSYFTSNSYFVKGGGISATGSPTSSYVGGLVGFFDVGGTLITTNSYWSTDAPQDLNGMAQSSKRAQGNGNTETNPSGATGLRVSQLKSSNPNNLLLPRPGLGDAWDLGESDEIPAIKICINPDVNSDIMCTSYGKLLGGQRAR